MSVRAPVGDININHFDKICIGRGCAALRTTGDLNQLYLYYWLKFNPGQIVGNKGLGFESISRDQITTIQIPLPPLDIQKKIAAEIEAVEKQAEKERQAIDKVMSELNDLVNSFGMTLRINDVCTLSDKKVEPSRKPDDAFAYIGLEHIESNNGILRGKAIVKGATLRSSKNSFTKGNLLYGKLRPYLNKVYLAEFDGVCSTDILVLKPNNSLILKHILLNKTFVEKASSLMKGTSLPRVGVKAFMNLTVKYPDSKVQANVVKKLLNYEQRINEFKSHIAEAEFKKTSIMDKHLK